MAMQNLVQRVMNSEPIIERVQSAFDWGLVSGVGGAFGVGMEKYGGLNTRSVLIVLGMAAMGAVLGDYLARDEQKAREREQNKIGYQYQLPLDRAMPYRKG